MSEKSGKERLLVNIVASVIATVVGLGIAFLLTPYLVAKIGKETYSFYPIASNLVNYFTIIVTAFNALASRFITIEIVKNNINKAQEYSSSVLFTNVILASIFVLPMSFIVAKADVLFDISPDEISNVRILFSLVFAAMLINIIGSVYGVATFVKERIDLRSYQQIAISILRVVLYVFLLIVFKPNIVFVGVVTLFESVANFVIQYLLTNRLLPEYKIKFSLARFRAVKEMLFSGIWSSINSLGSNLLSGLTLVISNILFGAVASGTLSIAQTLPSLCTTIITMMINVFYPRLTNQYARTNKEGLAKEAALSERIMGAIISVPIVLLIGLGFEFFTLWMPNENASELQIASVIYLIPYVIQANMWTLTQVYPVINKVRTPAVAMVILGAINLVLCFSVPRIWNCNYYVIPLISTVLNLIYCMFFVPICVAKYLSCSPWKFYAHLIRAAIASSATLLTTHMIRSVIVCSDWVRFVLCGFACAVFGYLFFLTLTLNRDDRMSIIAIFRKRKALK